jgi:hypothetical protein
MHFVFVGFFAPGHLRAHFLLNRAMPLPQSCSTPRVAVSHPAGHFATLKTLMGMTGDDDFLLALLYQWQDLNKRSSGFGPFATSSFKLWNILNLELELHRHSIFVFLNGFFGIVLHFMWQTDPFTILLPNRAWLVFELEGRPFDFTLQLLYKVNQAYDDSYDDA